LAPDPGEHKVRPYLRAFAGNKENLAVDLEDTDTGYGPKYKIKTESGRQKIGFSFFRRMLLKPVRRT
jgi:hypothetical protein